MSYITLEVEIDYGQIVPREPSKLPAKEKGLLTVLESTRQMFQSIVEFSQADAEAAAKLFNQTGRRSRSLANCMIAATAIRCGAKLATITNQDFHPLTRHGLALA